jgi:hypothetical protein
LKNLSSGVGARRLAVRTVAFVCAAVALASCGDGDSYTDTPEDDTTPVYSIDFHAESAGNYGALQFDIRHLANSGGFVGRADKVDCVPLVDAIVASNYLGERMVKIGMISLQGIQTPADLMHCRFRTREELDASDFEIEVTDASDTSSQQVEPPVMTIRVSAER